MAKLSDAQLERRRNFRASLETAGVKVGLIHQSLYVSIIRTSNPYVKAGARGVLTIHETSVLLGVIAATFREVMPDGRLAAPVEVRDVAFQSDRFA